MNLSVIHRIIIHALAFASLYAAIWYAVHYHLNGTMMPRWKYWLILFVLIPATSYAALSWIKLLFLLT